MNTVAISVIVAIYQAEAYLKRCVDSILNQTFTDFEVLLIDDGSSDRSGEICDEYAKNDTRIRVYHKQNEGRCLTRKKGIVEARGEYTIHCDPDDWMEPNMLETLYRKAKETDADIVLSDVWLESEKGSSYLSQKPSSLTTKSLVKELYQPIMPSLWNKLIRRECYAKFEIIFDKNVEYAEDAFILLQLFKHPVRLAYVPQALYHYDRITNPNNITKHIDLETYIRSVNCFDAIVSDEIMYAVNKIKSDVVWYCYNHRSISGSLSDTLYPEIDSFLLKDGACHPLKHWNYWVMWLSRKGQGWVCTWIKKIVVIYSKHKNSNVCG